LIVQIKVEYNPENKEVGQKKFSSTFEPLELSQTPEKYMSAAST
jgi:hypothetical protein